MELFNRSLVKFVGKVNSWQEGITIASNLLVDQGYVDQNFAMKLIEQTNQLGPYYVLANDLAMAHISPDDSIKKNGMSLLYLNEPVNFGIDEQHDVKFLFVLAATDQTSHLELLSQMATVFGNQNFYQDFYQVKSFDDIQNLLNKHHLLTE